MLVLHPQTFGLFAVFELFEDEIGTRRQAEKQSLNKKYRECHCDRLVLFLLSLTNYTRENVHTIHTLRKKSRWRNATLRSGIQSEAATFLCFCSCHHSYSLLYILLKVTLGVVV